MTDCCVRDTTDYTLNLGNLFNTIIAIQIQFHVTHPLSLARLARARPRRLALVLVIICAHTNADLTTRCPSSSHRPTHRTRALERTMFARAFPPSSTVARTGGKSSTSSNATPRVALLARSLTRPHARPTSVVTHAAAVDRREMLFASTALVLSAFAAPTAPRASADTIVNPQPLEAGWMRFYGEATSSSSYGGYGGNENNFDKFKYYFDVPDNFERDTVNKVEKSTNGTDARWKSKANKSEVVYCVTLAGYKSLKEDREGILSDLALSDYNLQDAIVGADSLTVSERDENGQTYVDYVLVGFFGTIYVSITVYASRLYSVFAVIPEGSSAEEIEKGKRMTGAFRTINNRDEAGAAADLEFYARS